MPESKTIVVDPGHGGTADKDQFRVGPTGEREEWINLRVALFIEKFLKEKGYQVVMTRTEDCAVDLSRRVEIGLGADLFLSVHHNSADPIDRKLDYPFVFVGGSLAIDGPSLTFAKELAREFSQERQQKAFIFSDQLIYSEGLHLLREMPESIPTVISEFSFFSEPFEEKQLQDPVYCQRVAKAYVRAIEAYFKLDKTYSADWALPVAHNFFRTDYRERLSRLRELTLKSDEKYTATEYGLLAQTLFNQKKYDLGREQLDKSLALLINGPYLVTLLQLGLELAHKLGEDGLKEQYKALLDHAVLEVL